MPIIFASHKPVSVFGFNSTVAPLSQGHETPTHHQGSLAASVRSYLGVREYSPQTCTSFYAWFFSFCHRFLSYTPLLVGSLDKKHDFLFLWHSVAPLLAHRIVYRAASSLSLSRSCLCDFTFYFVKIPF